MILRRRSTEGQIHGLRANRHEREETGCPPERSTLRPRRDVTELEREDPGRRDGHGSFARDERDPKGISQVDDHVSYLVHVIKRSGSIIPSARV